MENQPHVPPPHVIRLRDPWEVEPAAGLPDRQDSSGETPGECHLGDVRFHRGFGLPTGLHPNDQIDLVIDQVSAPGRVSVNNRVLGEFDAAEPRARFSLVGLLLPRNRVTLGFAARQVQEPPAEASAALPSLGDFVGEVRLEIRSGPA